MPNSPKIDPNIMRLEVRYANLNQPPKRKISGGAKFARALGSFLGPVGMAASFFFPPMAIAGMAAYGLRNQAQRAINQQQTFIQAERAAYGSGGPQQVQYFGYQNQGGSYQPVGTGAMGVSPAQDQVMNILFLRNEASDQVIHSNWR